MAQPALTVPIAGYQWYRGARTRLVDLALGSPLRLVREPTNAKDALAVQIWVDDQMLGYVPKTNNVDVAWALDGGVAVEAVFAGFGRDELPAIQLVWP